MKYSCEEDLSARINQILVVHAMAGLLDDFTPEQMSIFDEVVKRK
jgi:hypothetical protein